MEPRDVEKLAQQLLSGQVPLAEFLAQLAGPAMAQLPDATVDLDRQRRCGFPEVVYAEGKTAESIVEIIHAVRADGSAALATRVSAEQAAQLCEAFSEGQYNEIGRTFRIEPSAPHATPRGHVAVVTAGTSDRPVAEEAHETLLWAGTRVTMIQDVGVAGPHRFPAHLDKLKNVDAVIVIAGMEGALPSVVGGYVDCPVIAVPTSVGYGAALGGIAALLGMLNSCASNVTVVNIDAGFKAGYVAALIAKRRQKNNL